MKRKRVVVLGATGSIGDSALKVAHDIPDHMEVVGVAAPVFVADFGPVLVAFFVPGSALPPVLLVAAGVGVGVAVGWLLAPEFCAVAIVAMTVASARICISFISIPFCALFILKSFTASRSPAGLVVPPSAALEPAVRPVRG